MGEAEPPGVTAGVEGVEGAVLVALTAGVLAPGILEERTEVSTVVLQGVVGAVAGAEELPEMVVASTTSEV